MSVTVSTVQRPTLPTFYTVTDVTLDSSYAEGGEPVTAVQLGLAVVDHAWCNIKNGPESEEWVAGAWFTASDMKVHLQNAKTGKELAKEKDMSKVVVRVFAFGKARSK